MDFDAIVRRVQESDPTMTADDVQRELDWLVEHGYLACVSEVWDEEAGAWVAEH